MTSKRLFAALGTAVAVFALAATASATAPTKITVEFGPQVTTYPAGTYCDFDLQRTLTVQVKRSQYYDNQGNPSRFEAHIHVTAVHENLATGYVLSEDDVVNISDAGDGAKIVGLIFHLRDSSGKLVLVEAGQIDLATGKVTPDVSADSRVPECAALGGHAV